MFHHFSNSVIIIPRVDSVLPFVLRQRTLQFPTPKLDRELNFAVALLFAPFISLDSSTFLLFFFFLLIYLFAVR